VPIEINMNEYGVSGRGFYAQHRGHPGDTGIRWATSVPPSPWLTPWVTPTPSSRYVVPIPTSQGDTYLRRPDGSLLRIPPPRKGTRSWHPGTSTSREAERIHDSGINLTETVSVSPNESSKKSEEFNQESDVKWTSLDIKNPLPTPAAIPPREVSALDEGAISDSTSGAGAQEQKPRILLSPLLVGQEKKRPVRIRSSGITRKDLSKGEKMKSVAKPVLDKIDESNDESKEKSEEKSPADVSGRSIKALDEKKTGMEELDDQEEESIDLKDEKEEIKFNKGEGFDKVKYAAVTSDEINELYDLLMQPAQKVRDRLLARAKKNIDKKIENNLKIALSEEKIVEDIEKLVDQTMKYNFTTASKSVFRRNPKKYQDTIEKIKKDIADIKQNGFFKDIVNERKNAKPNQQNSNKSFPWLF